MGTGSGRKGSERLAETKLKAGKEGTPRGWEKVGKREETGPVASFPLPTRGAGLGRGAAGPRGLLRPWDANAEAGERTEPATRTQNPCHQSPRRPGHGRLPHPRRRAGRPGDRQPAAHRGVRGDRTARSGRPGRGPERAWGPPWCRGSCCPTVAGT